MTRSVTPLAWLRRDRSYNLQRFALIDVTSSNTLLFFFFRLAVAGLESVVLLLLACLVLALSYMSPFLFLRGFFSKKFHYDLSNTMSPLRLPRRVTPPPLHVRALAGVQIHIQSTKSGQSDLSGIQPQQRHRHGDPFTAATRGTWISLC